MELQINGINYFINNFSDIKKRIDEYCFEHNIVSDSTMIAQEVKAEYYYEDENFKIYLF